MLIRIYTFLGFFFFILNAHSTHIVGGEFNLSWKGRGANYLLSLNMYYDEINADKSINLIAQAITVVIFEKRTNAFVKEVYMTLNRSNVFVEYNNRYCARGDLLTRILYYTADISLPPDVYNNPDGYYVIYDLCCRNTIISNIANPTATGMIFYMEFPARSQVNRNSSPRFRPIEGEYFCADIEHTYDFSATDPDGDSLVYSLTHPIKGNTIGNNTTQQPGPYLSVDWLPGYGVNNMIPGNPRLTIDRHTGMLNVKPDPRTVNGVFVMAVKVDEYRYGEKIGSVHREFQFKIVQCDINYEPLVQFREAQGAYFAPDDTLIVEFAETKCLQFEISDSSSLYDGAEIILIKTSGTLPEDVLTIQPGRVALNPDFPVATGEACMVNCKSIVLEQDSIFDFKVIVSDDGCPVPLRDTATVKVLLKGRVNNKPVAGVVGSQHYHMIVGDTVDFIVYGTDSDPDDLIDLRMEGNELLMNTFTFDSQKGRDSINGLVRGAAQCDLLGNTHTLFFTVTDESCSPSKSDMIPVEITVEDKPTEIVNYTPVNLITPNGDGKNDYFYLKDLPEGNCSLFFTKIEIFNRWGGKVFISNDPAFRWEARDTPSGMYYYRINLNEDDIYGWINVVKEHASVIEKGF